MCWAETRPTSRHFLVPVIHEDDLPDDMPSAEYDKWYAISLVVDGVRIGPIYM